MINMTAQTKVINHKQLDLLKGFFAHCWCVYHEKTQQGFSFWAEQLDKANIPWSIQNIVAVSAEDKASINRYLTSILKDRDIIIA